MRSRVRTRKHGSVRGPRPSGRVLLDTHVRRASEILDGVQVRLR